MSRKAIFVTLAIVILLGLGGIGYVGWRYATRDMVAIGYYRVELPEGTTLEELVEAERTLLTSDVVLEAVLAEHNLVEHWGFATKEEALAHMREKLIIRPGKMGDRFVVRYRDRQQTLALQILQSINEGYVKLKESQGDLRRR